MTSTILTSFSGISDPGNYPPENALAVGPESIVTAESVPYEVTNLSGGAATTGSQFQLFSSLGPTLDNSVFDTRAAYDSSTGRFVLIANNLQPGGTATNIDIAISKDSNPADGWFVASIDTSNGGTTQSDMPYLSVSSGNIYITAPEFSGSPLVGSAEWVVSESSIASGSPQILASATTPAADAIMRNVSANGVTYYVSAQSNASQTQLTYQTYSAASGFSAPQTLMLGNSDKGPIGGDYAAQQAGTSLTLDAGDARIESLAYANGYLYGVSETLPTGASAPEIHWFKLDVSNPASPQLVIQGDLSGSLLGDPNIALFNASIAVDGRGDVLINFTASGPNMDPSDYYVVQGAQDSSFGTPTLYQASTSYFQQTPGATGMQRWGTYSSAVADPASQGGFWISNEYVTSTGVTIPAGLSAWWDTVVTNVQVAPYVPILSGAGTTATFTQGGAVAPLDAALTVKDVGSSTLAGATIAISGGLLAGDALNFSNQAGIVGSYNAATGVLTLSGTASLATYQTALESITYSSSSADASGAGADPSRTITWTVTDGAQTSTPITTSVDIAAASSVAASFSGISDPTNYPPQNALAVGPQSIVTAESSRYEVTNLTGGAATTGSLFSLFSSLGTTLDNSTYDPRAAYDSSTGRFVLIVNNIQPGGSTNIDIAVSNDSNPTDGWSVASLDTSTGGTTQSDMPDLSVTGTDGNIDLTAPEYPASGFAGTGQWVISESSILSGSPQVIASQTAPASDAIMRNISGGNGLTYYVSAFSNGSQSELTYETYSAAAGFSGTQTLALGNNDQGPGGTDYTAQQAGTSLTLDAGDSHIQSLAYANGYLYGVSETMPTGASAPNVHWFKLDVSNAASPRVVSQGDLSGSLLGNANIALFNPSIAVDGTGDVLINFTASGPNMDPSDYYIVQGANDLTFGAPTRYQASTSYFQQAPGSTGAQRWGTYSSAVADPNNPNGFWISNEYVANTGVTIPSGLSAWWDTVVSQVSVGGSVATGPVVVSVATFLANQTTLDQTTGGFAISDTAANVAANLAALNADAHVTSIALTDAGTPALTLIVAQALADTTALGEIKTPYTIAISDTAAHIQALTAAQITGLGNLHVTQIAASDTSVGLSVALATALEAANMHVTAPAGSTVTLSDISTNLTAMSVSLIAGLGALGVSGIVSTNGSVNISVQQAIAVENAGLRITKPGGVADTVTVKDLAANLAALTTGQIAALPGAGVSALTASDASVTLSVAQAVSLEAVKLKISVPSGDKVAVSDTAANVGGLTAAQIAALAGAGVTAISVGDANNVALTVAQAAAFETAKIALTLQSGQQVTVSDTAANIATLTATQIAGLGALHVTQIHATDTTVRLTISQANALESANIPIVAAPLSLVQISDTAANLQTLTAVQINGLAAIGVSGLVSTNAAVRFTVAQTIAIEGSHLTVKPFSGTTVTVSDTGLNIATITAAQIGLLAATGFSSLTSTSGGVALSVAQTLALEGVALKITVPSGSKFTISDMATNIAAMSASQMAALSRAGVSGITVTDTSMALSVAQTLALESPPIKVSVPTGSAVAVSGTASAIQALAATQITGLKAVGVTILSASDANVSLTIAQATALESAGVGLSPPSGGHDSIVDTAAHIQALTAAQIAGLGNLHVTQIAASDTNVALTVAQAAALESAGVPVAAPSGSHVTVSDTAAHLQTLTVAQINGFAAIGVSGLNSNNANVTFSATQTSAIVSANLSLSASTTHTIAETFTNGAVITSASNGAGGGNLTLSTNANGVTVSDSASALNATAGAETIPLTPYATESIGAAGRTSDTFAFGPGFGNDTILGFAATGASHDLLQFEASMFSYLTPEMTQAQELAAVLSHATTSGVNTTISDTLASRDSLTLNSVTVATLTANPADFKFV